MGIQVISFKCVLKNSAGQLISSTSNNGILSEGPEDGTLKALSDGLRDLKKGDRRRICVPAEQAYGFYDPSKVVTRAPEDFPHPETLKLGEAIKYVNAEGATMPLRITEIHQDRIVMDGNHPLAGQDLVFEIEALDARPATQDEIDDANPQARPDGRLLH